MLNGGGRAIEDIREIKVDEGLRELLSILNSTIPKPKFSSGTSS